MNHAAPSIPAPADAQSSPRTDAPGGDDALQAARATLSWATRVGTDDPEALQHPPAEASPETIKALDVGFVRECLDALLLGRRTREGLEALPRALSPRDETRAARLGVALGLVLVLSEAHRKQGRVPWIEPAP